MLTSPLEKMFLSYYVTCAFNIGCTSIKSSKKFQKLFKFLAGVGFEPTLSLLTKTGYGPVEKPLLYPASYKTCKRTRTSNLRGLRCSSNELYRKFLATKSCTRVAITLVTLFTIIQVFKDYSRNQSTGWSNVLSNYFVLLVAVQ